MTTHKALFGLFALVALAGCNTSDDSMSRFVVAPDKYTLYGCAQLAEATQVSLLRQRELDVLMQKASADSSGRMMSSLAYRSEYVSIKGDLREQQRTAREKNCNPQPTKPASRQSDVIIR